MENLPTASQRFVAAASKLGIRVDVVEMPASTRTAEEAAAACGVGVAQIVKSLVFQRADTNAAVMLLVSGANRVDTARVQQTLGLVLKRADAEAVRSATGFAIGGIPPFGHLTALETYMDETLLALAPIWAAAGTPNTVFATTCAALAQATRAACIRVA